MACDLPGKRADLVFQSSELVLLSVPCAEVESLQYNQVVLFVICISYNHDLKNNGQDNCKTFVL